MERRRKAQFEILSLDKVSDDIRIATLSDIYTREEHFAVQALIFSDDSANAESEDVLSIVYFRTTDGEHAVRLARKLANTFHVAARSGRSHCSCGHGKGSGMMDCHCSRETLNGRVKSLGATCAEAIAIALGWTVAREERAMQERANELAAYRAEQRALRDSRQNHGKGW